MGGTLGDSTDSAVMLPVLGTIKGDVHVATGGPAGHAPARVAAIKVIAPKGKYAGWRATRATGDFDLRTFEIRAHPVPPIPELRPGMSVYAEAPS